MPRRRTEPPAALAVHAVETALGTVLVTASADGIVAVDLPGSPRGRLARPSAPAAGAAATSHAARAARELARYLDGAPTRFTVPVDLSSCSEFSQIGRAHV